MMFSANWRLSMPSRFMPKRQQRAVGQPGRLGGDHGRFAENDHAAGAVLERDRLRQSCRRSPFVFP